MKHKVNGLIIVEGKTDIDFLSSFIDAKFYSVNGSAVNKEDFDFIKECSKKMTCIVLTDPDFPGKKIRQQINHEIPRVFNAYVRKEYSIKKHKVGVAESTKEEVLLALKNIVKYENVNQHGTISMYDLLELGLVGENSQEKRDDLCNKLHIGHSNSKQLLKKLNMLGLSRKDIEGNVN